MSAHLKNPLVWLHGLIAAFIGGGTSVIVGISVDAAMDGDFKINAKRLGIKAVITGAIFAGAYLKQSPLPPIVEVDTQQIKKSDTDPA
jgi:hypothetical protein